MNVKLVAGLAALAIMTGVTVAPELETALNDFTSFFENSNDIIIDGSNMTADIQINLDYYSYEHDNESYTWTFKFKVNSNVSLNSTGLFYELGLRDGYNVTMHWDNNDIMPTNDTFIIVHNISNPIVHQDGISELRTLNKVILVVKDEFNKEHTFEWNTQ